MHIFRARDCIRTELLFFLKLRILDIIEHWGDEKMAIEMMNSRCKQILMMLAEADSYITVEHIAEEFKLSRRSIYYEICKINEWMEANELPEMEIVRGKGILLEDEVKLQIESKLEADIEETDYIFSPSERIQVMICYIIHSETPVYIEQLADYCKVSRNTVFNDLHAVISQLQEYDLKLEYETKKGYFITGDVIRIRALFGMYFHLLQPLFNSGVLKFINREEIGRYQERLEKIEKELHIDYVEGILMSLAALMPLMQRDEEELYFPGLKKEELVQTREFELIEKYFPELRQNEKIYLCLHLLGSRVSVVSEDFFENRSDQSVYEITKALVAEFEKVACVEFEDRESLERDLFVHINASLYRYQYGIQIGNVMQKDIVREYPNLFEITKIVGKYLEQQVGVPISDGEIGYLALHFGAHLHTEEKNVKKLRILIVCVNGISTGNMLKREVARILPDAIIVGVAAAADIRNVHNICDIVITTVRIQSLVPVIVVHPILTDVDRKRILEHPSVRESTGIVDVDALYENVKKYVDKDKREQFKKALQRYFKSKENQPELQVIHQPEGLCDYLDDENIFLIKDKMQWAESIRVVGGSLLRQKKIEEAYLEKIITQIRYYGPYMFITPDVILAHAKPEDGVKHLGVSIGIFQTPVYYAKFHEAKIVLILAAEDQEKHLKILKDIMKIFAEDHVAESLQNLSTKKEVKKRLQEILNTTEEI